MAYDLSKVVVTSSPHIKADDDTRSLMLDVLIALVPALAVAVYTFGARALIHNVDFWSKHTSSTTFSAACHSSGSFFALNFL